MARIPRPDAYLVTYKLAQELPGADNHYREVYIDGWRAQAFVDDCNRNETGHGAIHAELIPLFREV